MDVSKEYVKMCKEAKEIQKGWKHRAGDFCCPGFDNIIWIVGFNVGFDKLDRGNLIWLPRQDQLQEMVNENNLTALLQDFISWLSKECNLPMHNTSMEQLWLVFVMLDNNKSWDGKEWQEV